MHDEEVVWDRFGDRPLEIFVRREQKAHGVGFERKNARGALPPDIERHRVVDLKCITDFVCPVRRRRAKHKCIRAGLRIRRKLPVRFVIRIVRHRFDVAVFVGHDRPRICRERCIVQLGAVNRQFDACVTDHPACFIEHCEREINRLAGKIHTLLRVERKHPPKKVLGKRLRASLAVREIKCNLITPRRNTSRRFKRDRPCVIPASADSFPAR